MNALEIKNIRLKLNLSQKDFGKMLGVGLRSVQNWESGDRNISESARLLLIELLKNEHSSHKTIINLEEQETEIDIFSEDSIQNKTLENKIDILINQNIVINGKLDTVSLNLSKIVFKKQLK